MPKAKTKALTSADDVHVNVSEPKAKPTAKPSGILWTVILNINNRLLLNLLFSLSVFFFIILLTILSLSTINNAPDKKPKLAINGAI